MKRIIEYFKKVFGFDLFDEVKETVTDEEKQSFRKQKNSVDWVTTSSFTGI